MLEFAERGLINQRILSDQAIQEQLSAGASDVMLGRLNKVLDALPTELGSIQKLIDDRKAMLLEIAGDPSKGKSVFVSKCEVCHQVNGKGKQVGPNLDGVGNRGVDRLIEDVLAPHRNVDISFRASTLVLEDGRSLSGLIKNEDERMLTIVDSQGVAKNIAKREIEVRKQSKISAMPGNVGAEIRGQDFLDLMSYLLTLNH